MSASLVDGPPDWRGSRLGKCLFTFFAPLPQNGQIISRGRSVGQSLINFQALALTRVFPWQSLNASTVSCLYTDSDQYVSIDYCCCCQLTVWNSAFTTDTCPPFRPLAILPEAPNGNDLSHSIHGVLGLGLLVFLRAPQTWNFRHHSTISIDQRQSCSTVQCIQCSRGVSRKWFQTMHSLRQDRFTQVHR